MSRDTCCIIQLAVLQAKEGKMTRVPSTYDGGCESRKNEGKRSDESGNNRKMEMAVEAEMEPLQKQIPRFPDSQASPWPGTRRGVLGALLAKLWRCGRGSDIWDQGFGRCWETRETRESNGERLREVARKEAAVRDMIGLSVCTQTFGLRVKCW
ncbi:hypothetical protein ACMFMG_009589 [Clarireedia jacksonii]